MITTESPIAVQCPKCQHGFRVRARGAGKTVRCPECGDPTKVPEAANGGEQDADPDPQPDLPRFPVASLPQVATAPTAIRTHSTRLPQSRSYPILSVASAVLMIAGAIIGIGALVTFFGGLVLAIAAIGTGAEDAGLAALGVWLFTAGPATLAAVVLGVLLVASAEMLNLAMHVQENTLATAHAARRE